MLTVTDTAQEEVLLYFKGNEIKPLRIFLSSGCGGRQLALAEHEIQPQDSVFTFGDLTFVIEPSLLKESGPIIVDWTSEGFSFKSNISDDPGSGCDACRSAAGCG